MPSMRSFTEADAHYAAKSLFARTAPQVLRDYIAAGIEADPADGVRLAIKRGVETQLFNTLPQHLGRPPKTHPPACPLAFIGGTQSNEIRQAGLAATRAVTQGPSPGWKGRTCSRWKSHKRQPKPC